MSQEITKVAETNRKDKKFLRTRNRRWVFTSFHVLDETITDLKQTFEKYAKFAVFQKEEGDKKNHPHLQGYVEWVNPYAIGTVKRRLGFNDIHVEVARGDKQKNIDYCTKVEGRLGGPWMIGDARITQGYRTDLVEFKQDIEKMARKRKEDWTEIVDKHLGNMVRYHTFGRWYYSECIRKEMSSMSWRQKRVVVIIGSAGKGKTRVVRETCEKFKHDLYAIPCGSGYGKLWFNAYVGQKCCLIDDYRGEIGISLFLRLLDGWPEMVETKGGFTIWNPKTVFITSNCEPHQWYPLDWIQSGPALMRRISEIIHLEEEAEELPDLGQWLPTEEEEDLFDVFSDGELF